MKTISTFCLLIVLSGCSSLSEPEYISPPNVVLFLVDDLGWQDTSIPFWTQPTKSNQTYRTPNLSKLATQGVKFTQAYATAVCSPTRVSLMTGMNAARHRVTNWTLIADQIQPMESNHQQLEFPFWNVNGLSPEPWPHAVHATPLPQLLQSAGYRTIHVGKAHFGAINTPGADPKNLGFDVNIAGHAAGAPKSYYGLDNFGNTEEFKDSPWPVPGLEQYHGQDVYLTDVLTDEALKALDQSTDPFFLYMSYYTVHTPIMGNNQLLDHYLSLGLDSIEAQYATMIETMDQSVGRILDYLEQKQLSDQTIILFMSDNGGLSAVARGGEPHTHNYPLASGKGSIMEGGIREPMLVKWPGVTEANTQIDDYLIIEDFYPTILEMCGVDNYETIQHIDGRSFVSLLTEPTASASNRPLYWHYPNQWGPSGPGIGAYSAVRQGDWKLIYYHLDERFALYNLADDLGEKHNLAEALPDKLLELSNQLTHHLQDVEAQMPVHKSSGAPVRWPNEAIKDLL